MGTIKDIVKLDYRDDGVYLSITGNPENPAQVIEYLKQKEIKAADPGAISKALSGESGTVLISVEPQAEKILDESVTARVSGDMMEAYAVLVPPDDGGGELSESDIKRELETRYKITYGIDDEAIAKMVQQRDYGQETLVAKGDPPVDGENAEITYNYDMKALQSTSFQAAGDEDKIDFRNLYTFVMVTAGEVLASKTPVTPAIDGKNVRGSKMAARKGKDAVLPAGKNTLLSEDKLSVLAKIDGRLEVDGGKMTVSPSLRIPGDVDMSVGNITFDGDVEIGGNVNAGFEIKAGGNVTINGMVESALVESGGDIILKNGIQGADKGLLRAKGSIVAKYIERSTVEAGTNVTTEFALHSNIMGEGYVEVVQGRGTIIGGTVAAGQYVAAKTIGTDSDVVTNIDIGVSPKKRARLKEAKEMLPQVDAGLQRMELALQAAAKAQSDTAGKARLQISIQIGNFKKEIEDLTAEIAELEKEIEGSKKGKIHVLDKVYRGTKLSIGSDVLQIKGDNQYVTFYRDYADKREITFTSCLYKTEREAMIK